MGKLEKLPILVMVLILLVLVIVAGKVLFLKHQNNKPDAIKTAISAQSFGRGVNKVFSKTDSERLGEVADPNYKVSFPKDHYSHDLFDIEWWYLTANLQDDEGNDYGLQWTLFRFRNPNFTKVDITSDWSNEHIYMAHASVHSASRHWFSEKFARGDVGNAGVEQSPFKLFLDDWQWSGPTAGLLPATLSFNAKLVSKSAEVSAGSDVINEAEGSHLNVQLNLSNTGPYVLQGQDGYSIKSANAKHASHYYSAPFINVSGAFTINKSITLPDHNPGQKLNESKKRVVVKGKAWFDQEWTSQLFDQATLGWDWLSLHLDNGDKIMAFRMRLKDQPDYITGTYIESDGSTTTLKPQNIVLNPIQLTDLGNKKLPLDWQLKIEKKNIDLRIKATKKDQWNPASIAYYEGTVGIIGSHKGKGFLELTGY